MQSAHSALPLVLAGCGLACLELVQVPAADGQAALVLVHALAEVVDVARTCAGRLHLCRVLVLLCEFGVLGRGVGGGGGAAAEPAADCVADRGSDGDTAEMGLVYVGVAWF
jgi:hypothetical protein